MEAHFLAWTVIAEMLCPRSRLAMRACCSELMLIVDKQCVYEQFVRTQNKHQKYNNFNKQPLRVDRAAGFCTLLIANAGLAGGSQAERFAAACALRPYLPRVPRELNETAHALLFDQSGFWIGQCVVTAKTCKPRSALDALVAWGTLAETNMYLNAWALRPVCWNDATKIPPLRALVFEPVAGPKQTSVDPISAFVHVYFKCQRLFVPLCTVRPDNRVFVSVSPVSAVASFSSYLYL